MKKQLTYRQYMFRKKRRRRKLIGFSVFLGILAVGGLIAYAGFTIFKPQLGAVKGLRTDKVTVSTAEISWKKLSGAEGYYVYSRYGAEKFSKVADVTDTSYKFRNLKQATEYTFKVTPYDKEEKNGKNSTVTAFTLPEKPSITLARSRVEGVADIQWQKNESIDSYTLQYKSVFEDDYSNAKTLHFSVDDGSTVQLDELEPDVTYDIRMRCEVEYKGDTLRSGWSYAHVLIYKDEPEEPIITSQKMIALTFDDGPSSGGSSKKIVDILEKYDAKATFFMVGANAEANPKDVKRKAKLGMEIGTHTYDHSHYGDEVTAKDIKKANKAITKITGKAPTAFRSPGGITTDNILSVCKDENTPVYFWSIDTADWQTRDADTTYKRVVRNAEDGDIVLMHEIYDSTADALEKIVKRLQKDGFKLVTCSQLIKAKTGESPKAGVEYFSGK